MDEIDYRILRELQSNARISNLELSQRIGLSATPCWNRLRRLEREGVIEKYVAVFNQAALGMADTVIVEVRLERHDNAILERFDEALAALPETVEAYVVAGDYDYYIKAAVSGTAGCEAFLREKLYKIPGISHSRTSFTLRCLKKTWSVQPPIPKRRRDHGPS